MKSTEKISKATSRSAHNPAPFFHKKGGDVLMRQENQDHFFSAPIVQAKLDIGKPDDKFEQDADQVMGMPEYFINRKCETCEQEEVQPKEEKESEVIAKEEAESLEPQLQEESNSEVRQEESESEQFILANDQPGHSETDSSIDSLSAPRPGQPVSTTLVPREPQPEEELDIRAEPSESESPSRVTDLPPPEDQEAPPIQPSGEEGVAPHNLAMRPQKSGDEQQTSPTHTEKDISSSLNPTGEVEETFEPKEANPTNEIQSPTPENSEPGTNSPIVTAVRQLSLMSPVQAVLQFSTTNNQVKTEAKERRDEEKSEGIQIEFHPNPSAQTRANSLKVKDKPLNTQDGSLPELSGNPTKEIPIASHHHLGSLPVVAPGKMPEKLFNQKQEGQNAVQEIIERIRRWLNRFLSMLPQTDSGANTKMGKVEKVELEGEQDPNQIDELHESSAQKLQKEAVASKNDRDKNYGEGEIESGLDFEKLTRKIPNQKPLPPKACDLPEVAQEFFFDPKDEQDLTNKVSPTVKSSYELQIERITQAEQERDKTILAERIKGNKQAKQQHSQAHKDQLKAISHAQSEVAAAKEEWHKTDKKSEADFDKNSRHLRSGIRKEITSRKNKDNAEIKAKVKKTEKKAEDEKTSIEKEAKRVKNKPRKKSRGWLSRGVSWVKGKVTSAINWVRNKIKNLFSYLRAKIKSWFNAAKKWIKEKIDQAKNWIKRKLETARRYMISLVDKHLGKYPAVARFAKKAINVTIDGAQIAVDVAAETLKVGVDIVVDTVAFAVDTALGVAEWIIDESLKFVCSVAATGFNAMLLVIDRDLEALITFIHELPEIPVIGPILALLKMALIGFIEGVMVQPPDRKKKFATKLLKLVISPSYHLGVLWGTIVGVVKDGLWGTIKMIYDLITGIPKAIKDIYDFFVDFFKELTVEDISEILAEGAEVKEEVLKVVQDPSSIVALQHILLSSPLILFQIISEGLKNAQPLARNAGTNAANDLFDFVINSSSYTIGKRVGRIIGYVAFEVAIAVFSFGGTAAAKLALKGMSFATKIVKGLVKGIVEGGKRASKLFSLVKGAIKTGLKFGKKIGAGLGGLFTKLGRFIDKAWAWFKKIYQRALKRKKGTPKKKTTPKKKDGTKPKGRKKKKDDKDDDDPKWLEIKGAIRRAVNDFEDKGATKAQAKQALVKVKRKYRKSALKVKQENKAQWKVTAIHPKWKKRLDVVEVWKDVKTRWRLGRKEMQKALDLFEKEKYTADDLKNRIRLPYKGKPSLQEKYGYKELKVKYDENDQRFEVYAKMNPEKPDYATKEPPVPKSKITYSGGLKEQNKKMVADPLTRKGKEGSHTTSSYTWPMWDKVQPIRSKGGAKSLYVRGHLLSAYAHGSGKDQKNLTPISGAANAEMESKFERYLPWENLGVRNRSKRVVRYEVWATGSGPHKEIPPLRVFEGSPRRRRVPEEREIPRTIKIIHVVKKYDKNKGEWVDDPGNSKSKASTPETIDNVPPYPPGNNDG